MEYGEGKGYGKVIVFGEHFVVYDLPGIVMGLPFLYTTVRVKKGRWNLKNKTSVALQAVKQAMNIEEDVNVTISSNIPIGQNLGSSAALSVAFARALNEFYRLNLDEKEIRAAAMAGERVFHGKPSGIDVEAALTPSFFIYTKSQGLTQHLNTPTTLHFTVTFSKPTAMSTSEAVNYVAQQLKDEDKRAWLFTQYQNVFDHAVHAIEQGNTQHLGWLMNVNHTLLYLLNLSTPAVENVRFQALKHNALGVKITGAGTGGNVLALFSDKQHALNFVKERGHYVPLSPP